MFLSKKYENTGIDLEDLVSIGTIGLIKGVNTYKLDKNIKLATYASRCIDNEILMFLRKNKHRRGERIYIHIQLLHDNIPGSTWLIVKAKRRIRTYKRIPPAIAPVIMKRVHLQIYVDSVHIPYSFYRQLQGMSREIE